MIAKKEYIDYILSGLRNLFSKRSYALNDNSIIAFFNGWVAVAIKNLVIGKATGICLLDVSNRLITKYILSMYSLWFSAVKTFKNIAIGVSIAIFKSLESLCILTNKGAVK